jgi:hypothetical protein
MMPSLYRKLTQIIYSHGSRKKVVLRIRVEFKTSEEAAGQDIYCSAECRAAFLFRFDVNDHKEMSGHDRMHELSFS